MKLMYPYIRLISFLVIIVPLIFIACKKETSESASVNEKTFSELLSNSDIEFSQAFDDVYNNVMGVNSEVAYGGTGIFGRIITVDSFANTCFTVKILRLNPPSLFPVQVTLDFGNGCVGKDSVLRKGKITTVYNGPLTQAGNAAESSFDNFYRNFVKVEGTQRIENISSAQQCIYRITIQDGKLTKTNGNYTITNSNNTITQIDGYATPNYAKDDVLSMDLESSSTIKNDSIFLKWNSKTIEPLIKKFTCQWMVKGKLEVVRSNTDKALIDFGNGDCDNKANLIINNSTTEISLH